MASLLDAADTNALVYTNALLGIAVAAVLVWLFAALVHRRASRRRAFRKTVRDAENEVRRMFRHGGK